MTIIATKADVAESPAVFLLMTCKARGGYVGSFQLEFALIVLFNGIRETGESLYIMTDGTIRIYSVSDEIPFVIIDMAVEAIVMLQGIGEICLVAGFAVYSLMLSFKGIGSLAMVEMIHSLHRMKGFFTMAGAAILAELVVMYVLMTAGAVAICNSLEFLELLPI